MEWFVGISCSIIAGIIMLIVFPTNIRDTIIKEFKALKTTLKFYITVDLTAPEVFIVKSAKRNNLIIFDYRKGVIDDT